MVNSSLDELDSCINCNAGLIAASSICPQCGWPKGKPIEPVKEDNENEPDVEESTEVEFVNRLPRPAGVRMLGMAYVVFGIIGVSVSIIFGSLIMYLIIAGAMSGLGAIGDAGMAMPMPLPTGGADPAIITSLGTISVIPGMEVIGNTMMGFANSSSMMDVSMMMEMMMVVGVVMAVGVMIGLVYFMFGRYLLRGNKWVRYLVIISAIISIPVIIPFVSEINFMMLGSAAVSGLILYYLFKPHVRAYFAQAPIKKPKNKESKIEKSEKS